VGSNDRTEFLAISSVNRNGAVIQDSKGNSAYFALPFDAEVDVSVQEQTEALEVGPAQVASVASSEVGEVDSGQTIELGITFTRSIIVNGSPTLALSDGAIATYDAALSDEASGSLVFDYTVGANDSSSDLEISSVNPNGASITDQSGYKVDFSGALNVPTYVEVGAGSSIGVIYEAVLQRSASSTELSAANALQLSIGVAGVIASIVDSPEAQYNVYPIVQIIELATGSFPTAAQLSGWVPFVETNGLLQGSSQTNPLLDHMAEAFVASTEFGNTYNGGTAVDPNAPITASIVSAIIHAATGIAAVQSQIDAWVSTGQTIDQVFVDFALGDQYSAHLQSAVQQYLTTTADAAAGGSGLGAVNSSTPNDGLTTTQVTAAYQAVLQR
jgi:hypothetical protein